MGEVHMKTIITGTTLAIVALAASQLALAQANPSRTLDITWIDVEGGEDTADCQGHEISAKVAADGKFTVTNGCNGFSKSYMARGN
jgi:heat shock protein HslJ